MWVIDSGMKTSKKSSKNVKNRNFGAFLLEIRDWSLWFSRSLYENQIRNLKLLFVFLSGSHFVPVYQYDRFHGLAMSAVVGFAFAYAEYSVTDKYSGFWETKTKFGAYREENARNKFRKWWLDKGLYMILLISVVVNTHYYIVQTKLFEGERPIWDIALHFVLGLLYSTVFPLFVFVLSMADDRAEKQEEVVEEPIKKTRKTVKKTNVVKIDKNKYKKPNPSYAPVVKGRNNKRGR